jgi:hypothetical protein
VGCGDDLRWIAVGLRWVLRWIAVGLIVWVAVGLIEWVVVGFAVGLWWV